MARLYGSNTPLCYFTLTAPTLDHGAEAGGGGCVGTAPPSACNTQTTRSVFCEQVNKAATYARRGQADGFADPTVGCRRYSPELPSSWPSRGRGAREILDARSPLPPQPLPHYLSHATQARATPPFVIRGGLCWKTPAPEKVSINNSRKSLGSRAQSN